MSSLRPTGSLTWTIAAAVAFASTGGAVAAQIQPPSDARLVAFLTEPRVPEFGEIYDFILTVRISPEVVAFMPDTLIPSDVSYSAGEGTWTTTTAPADSVDVRATYPVVSLVAGGVYTPLLEVFTRPPAEGEAAGVRPAREAAGDLDRILIPTGAIQILTMSDMSLAGEEGRVPRPPADVVGGQWSTSFVVGAGLVALVLVALAWLLIGRWRAGAGVPLVAPVSPREAALRELDRIRERGWHADGKLVDFYDASTGVLREYSGLQGADWSTALTSTQLMGRLAERWGDDAVESLGSAVWVAERVKFGSYRPGADAAETDWSTIRSWIEGTPED